MRDSSIFYRSFYEAISELPEVNQLEVYNAVFEYTFNFKENELKGLSKTIFTLIKPQLDANNKKFTNGKNGGRPPKDKQNETKEIPKNNQNETKSKANVNDNVNDNDNVNENLNNNDNDKKPKKVFTPPLLEDVILFFNENQYSDLGAKKAFEYYDEGNWKDSKGNQVKNWKQKMRGVWFKDEYKIQNEQSTGYKPQIDWDSYLKTLEDE